MPIQLQWLVQDRVIFGEYSGVITADEFRQAMSQTMTMIESSTMPLVHVIVDNTHVDEYPKSIPVLHDATKDLFSHPRYGWLLVYGQTDRLSSFFLQVITSLFKVRFRMMQSRADAVAFLQHVDVSIEAKFE